MSRVLPVLLAGLMLLAGCTGSSEGRVPPVPSPSPTASDAGPAYTRYVALGDSFSAGPLIPTTDLAGGCARSDHNYPSLVAQQLDVKTFVDVSCSGATTRDVAHPQHPFEGSTVPPQLQAVTADTDLVTIGIGGNDLDLFATLIGTCTRLRSSDPTGDPCARSLAATGPDLDTDTVVIAQHVTRVLRAIQRKAPKATIVLVGYLRLVPDQGTCPALPLATGDYPEGRRIASTLNEALSRAAARTSTTYVDAYALSQGHDICSKDPWVNGRLTQRDQALAYHPFASGMKAVAARLVEQLQTFG